MHCYRSVEMEARDLFGEYFNQELKSKMVRQTVLDWKHKWSQSDKGRFCYSILPNPSTISWFQNIKLSRKTITAINRIIANHSICASSLQRFNIVNNATCSCGENYETVDHKLFECKEITPQSREDLITTLHRAGINSPYDIRDIIGISVEKKHISVLEKVGEIIKNNNINI